MKDVFETKKKHLYSRFRTWLFVSTVSIKWNTGISNITNKFVICKTSHCVCVCAWIPLSTTVAHNTAQNNSASSDNFPTYPPNSHHSSDADHQREAGLQWAMTTAMACMGAVWCRVLPARRNLCSWRLHDIWWGPSSERPRTAATERDPSVMSAPSQLTAEVLQLTT